MYVLDTDIWTLYRRSHPVVCGRFHNHRADVATTIISVEEQFVGWCARIRRSRATDEVARFYLDFASNVEALAAVAILSFTEPAIRRYEHLKTTKINAAKMDLRIAAIVLENSAILVTRNVRDFKRVPGLIVEDWSV